MESGDHEGKEPRARENQCGPSRVVLVNLRTQQQ